MSDPNKIKNGQNNNHSKWDGLKNFSFSPKKPSNLELTERVLQSITPDPENFTDIYPDDEIRRDMNLLHIFKNSPNYTASGERSDAKILEKTFTDLSERNDWFSDFGIYGEDQNFCPLSTFPTSEIDDVFNHIDLVGIIKNSSTDNITLPFAIDLTYNTDPEKIHKKFSWRHVYGKNEKHAPIDSSEFGEIIESNHQTNNTAKFTKSLKLKQRLGTKLMGFTTAKYFEDRNSSEIHTYKKGRINTMPRLIVGYDPEIADILASGRPDKQLSQKYGKQYYDQRIEKYNEASRKAKWCTLLECAKQASDINQMVKNLTAEEKRYIYAKDLDTATKSISSLDKYFSRSLDFAIEQAQNNPSEFEAFEYAKKDKVQLAIFTESEATYLNDSTQNRQTA